MKTSTALLALFVLLSACSAKETKEVNSKSAKDAASQEALPNIIMLIGDDQGYPYFGFMGSEIVQTPNMDALAASGMVFTDGYVSDNHCRPSLQTLLTGMLPIEYYKRSEVVLEQMVQEQGIGQDSLRGFRKYFDLKALAMPAFETLPQLLAQKGYASFQGGKWWEYTYQNGGFSHGMTKGWLESEQKTKDWFTQHMGGEGMDLARVTNQPAYDFIEEAGEQPFFIWFAPSLPHYPFDAPEQYYNIYKDEDMSESAKQYYANCTWFDDAWGQMVDYLKANGHYENTLVVYVNDNGWEQEPDQEFWNDPMRSHNGGDKGKGSIYDMSFRSPMVFSFPGQIEAGRRSEMLIHSADIPATILDYVGMSLPEEAYGRSYRSVLEGYDGPLRNMVQGNVITTRSADPNNVMGDHVSGYWVREGAWFLRWHVDREEIELFNVLDDPRNDHNLAEAHPEVLERMMAHAKAYRDAHGEDPRLAHYRSLSGS